MSHVEFFCDGCGEKKIIEGGFKKGDEVMRYCLGSCRRYTWHQVIMEYEQLTTR